MSTTDASIASANLRGAACAAVAMLCFSLNDVGIKFLSDDYALHQVIFLRAIVGLITFALIILPFAGGLTVLRTNRLGVHLTRGFCVVAANMCFFLGLAALPIADAVAVFFVSPLVITVFSVIFLGERVGPRRWLAIAIGFVGILVIVKPGTSAFQVASLLPLAAAVLYATLHMLTRKIGGTESAATMVIYMQLTFLAASAGFGLAFGDGRFGDVDHASLAFFLRAWGPVAPADWWIIVMLGVSGMLGAFFISQAYRLSEAAFVAPVEYITMPLAIMWGITVFGTFPGTSAWLGIALIFGSGLYLVWRESSKGRRTRLRR